MSKSWHLGRLQTNITISVADCILRRNPTFQPGHLLPLVFNTQITEDLRRVLGEMSLERGEISRPMISPSGIKYSDIPNPLAGMNGFRSFRSFDSFFR